MRLAAAARRLTLRILRRLVPAARRRLPRPALRAEPRLAARPDRRHARRDRPVRGAAHLRGRRAEARARAGARPQRVRGRDPERALPVRRGITGWAVEHREPVLANQAHLDPRVALRAGHAGRARGADRRAARRARRPQGDAQRLPDRRATRPSPSEEFELAKRFGDAAALALDNAHIRARLEHQAQTDSLTGLYNHRYFHERLRHELTRASARARRASRS